MAIIRIHVDKNDEPVSVAEKIINVEAEEIFLNIPKFSKFAEFADNFHLIKREADALGKKLIIESVDDKVIEMSSVIGIDAVNPVFARYKRQFSDIVAQRPALSKKPKPDRRASSDQEETESEDPKPSSRRPERGGRTWPKFNFKFKFKLKPSFKLPLIILGGTAFLASTVSAAMVILPRADIEITAKKSNWEYVDSVAVDKDSPSINSANMKIPGQLFVQKKNLSLSFPANGKKNVEAKATGVISVFNAFSSDTQPLVAKTRFEAPDGKIYRLIQGITVPGAKIVDGKIVPSSIDAKAVADKAGVDYNIGPVEKFTIPGFRGSPKFTTFYGQSSGSMGGGFIGERAYPLDSDIKNAKEETKKKLEDSLAAALQFQIPKEFKTIAGATKIEFTKEEASLEVDASGNFTVLIEGEVKALVFVESNLKDALFEKAKTELGQDLEAHSSELEYTGKARANFQIGRMTFPVSFKSVLAAKVDADFLKQEVMGKQESELKSLIFSLPGLESARVSLWPFWVKKVPKNADRIKITVK